MPSREIRDLLCCRSRGTFDPRLRNLSHHHRTLPWTLAWFVGCAACAACAACAGPEPESETDPGSTPTFVQDSDPDVGRDADPDVGRQVRGTQCGPDLEFEPVNRYTGPLAWAQTREEAVVLINANCTGTYIRTTATDLFLVLTAGHCVNLGERASINFNFEAEPDGPTHAWEGTVIERSVDPDYALIELPQDPEVSPTPLSARVTSALTVIQHPLGQLKLLAEGELSRRTARQLHYTEIDTLVGSSGAGVLNAGGMVVGIHTLGECSETGGTNGGWTATSIVEASSVLRLEDLEDC